MISDHKYHLREGCRKKYIKKSNMFYTWFHFPMPFHVGCLAKDQAFYCIFFCNLPLYYMYIIFAMVVINPDHAVLELCDPVDFKDQQTDARKSQE